MSEDQDNEARASHKIFLNYRREDSSGYAGRLYDRLTARYGAENVFIDIDSLDPGVDFADAIHETLSKCGIVLVIIGRSWLNIVGPDGSRRLDDTDDFVRRELEAALSGTKRVIPILVGGAEMPKTKELPEPLKSLSRRHAVELSDRRWHPDTEYLIQEIEKGWTVTADRSAPRDLVQQHQPASERRDIHWEVDWDLCPGVVRFYHDDNGFVAWRDSHPYGYVVNCDHRPNRKYFKLHRTTCSFLNKGQSYTVAYTKLCAENKKLLDDCGWNLFGAGPDACPFCHP